MHYKDQILALDNTSVTDAFGTLTIDDLPDPQPEHPLRLTDAPPILERLWRIALSDIEKNIVETPDGRYFGAGKDFGTTVYTRDISYAGVLGLNALYPDIMRASLEYTRAVRRELGFRVSRGHRVPEIDVDWQEEDLSGREFIQKYHTNCYTRRTDDVIWLWAAGDLYRQGGSRQDWQWIYDTGWEFFERFYTPFYDPADGLYRGQASFVDIHFPEHKTTGYPEEWSIADCIAGKATSTNALYVKAMETMEHMCYALGKHDEAHEWTTKAEELRKSIRRYLRMPDMHFVYLRDRDESVQMNRHALGEALTVLFDVPLDEGESRKALEGYPTTDAGVPLFHPFFPTGTFYHNNSAWPFVDTLYFKALEKATGKVYTAPNAALLARTCREDGTFHEVVDMRDRMVKGSPSQLWSAAAFVDVCRRSGLVTFG